MGRLYDLLPAITIAMTGCIVLARADWLSDVPTWGTVVGGVICFVFAAEETHYVLRRRPAE